MTTADSADVVVVGGGTVRAWTAVHLAERGVGRVVRFDAAGNSLLTPDPIALQFPESVVHQKKVKTQ